MSRIWIRPGTHAHTAFIQRRLFSRAYFVTMGRGISRSHCFMVVNTNWIIFLVTTLQDY